MAPDKPGENCYPPSAKIGDQVAWLWINGLNSEVHENATIVVPETLNEKRLVGRIIAQEPPV